eukprot:17224-Pelagococcus_subviridis.AAC.4
MNPAWFDPAKSARLYLTIDALRGSLRLPGGSWSMKTSLCSVERICDSGSATARRRSGAILKLRPLFRRGVEAPEPERAPEPELVARSPAAAASPSPDASVSVSDTSPVAAPLLPAPSSSSCASPVSLRSASRLRRSNVESAARRLPSRIASSLSRSLSLCILSIDRIKYGADAAATSEMLGRFSLSIVMSRPTSPTSAAEYGPPEPFRSPPPMRATSGSNDGYRPSTIALAIVIGLLASNGGRSASMWYRTHPRDHTSAFAPYASCMMISGQLYGIVPTALCITSAFLRSRGVAAGAAGTAPKSRSYAFARPKSAIFTLRVSSSRRMLFGVKSRCTTFFST